MAGVECVGYNWGLLPPGYGPLCGTSVTIYLPGRFSGFCIKPADDIACKLFIGGGDLKVPCLRIGEGERGFQWMYESGDIIRYLVGRLVVAQL